MQTITLAQGSGGASTNELIQNVFLKHLGTSFVSYGEDAGVFHANGGLALSTDSFVITPIFFPGGDIGKLSVCGSSNDVAMMGAKPEFISLGFILEEGFSMQELESIVCSIATELSNTNIKILSADTKVVPKGSADKIFINTTCIGHIIKPNISSKALRPNDVIILSAGIGAHGASIFAIREGIELESHLSSDCAQLYPMLEPLFLSNLNLHTLRDATRGGLAAVLNEWAQDAQVRIEIDEAKILVDERVWGVCEILGLEATQLANEGVCVLGVARENADEVCALLQAHSLGAQACVIGEVLDSGQVGARVVLKNQWGGKRFMEYPQGELLPRIC